VKVAVAFLILISAAFASEIKPRESRVLIFTAKYCPHCHKIADGDDGFRKWLVDAGWSVGDGPENHIQIVDVEQRADLQERYKIESIPCMIRLDGSKVSAIHPYIGRKSLADLLTKDVASAKTVAKPKAGQHSHTCGRCGYRWYHGSESFGNPNAHRCAKCGAFQYVID